MGFCVGEELVVEVEDGGAAQFVIRGLGELLLEPTGVLGSHSLGLQGDQLMHAEVAESLLLHLRGVLGGDTEGLHGDEFVRAEIAEGLLHLGCVVGCDAEGLHGDEIVCAEIAESLLLHLALRTRA